jgi:hypothetical protein
MANTFPADLVHEIVAEQAITSLGSVLGAVRNFSFEAALSPIAPGSTVKVGVTTAGATASTNPTNYESGDSTKVTREVTVDEHSVSFHVTQAQLNKGHTLQALVRKNMQQIANAARDAVFGPLPTANYGAVVVDKTAANFSAADLKTVWAACKDFPTKHLLLDGAYYAQLLPTNAESFRPGDTGAYGFDSIGVNNRWDGADAAGIVGFCGTSDALVIASGEPAIDSALENVLDAYEEVPIDGGMSAYVYSWVSTATRSRWMSMGLMLGAQVGDATAGKLLGDGAA